MSDQAELWQGYSEQAEPDTTAGVSLQQSAAGALHGSAHVWVWHRNIADEIELLLQQRAADMPTWPGYWSVSAAGHQMFGEAIEQTAIRETQEEIGLKLKESDLMLLFTFRQRLQPTADIMENEIQWVYGVDGGSVQLGAGDGEVADLRWFTFGQIETMTAEGGTDKFVPHGTEYLEKLRALLS